ELGHGRTGVRRDLHQVEVGLVGKAQGVLQTDDPDLLTVRTDQAHLGDADPVVDAGLADVLRLVLAVDVRRRRGRPPPTGTSGGRDPLPSHDGGRGAPTNGAAPRTSTRLRSHAVTCRRNAGGMSSTCAPAGHLRAWARGLPRVG